MQTKFDKNFELQKSSFKQKFNKDWNTEPQLYLAYLQAVFAHDALIIMNGGIGNINSQQLETHRLIQDMSKKLDKK